MNGDCSVGVCACSNAGVELLVLLPRARWRSSELLWPWCMCGCAWCGCGDGPWCGGAGGCGGGAPYIEEGSPRRRAGAGPGGECRDGPPTGGTPGPTGVG